MLRDKQGRFQVVKKEDGGERARQGGGKSKNGKLVGIRGVHECLLVW